MKTTIRCLCFVCFGFAPAVGAGHQAPLRDPSVRLRLEAAMVRPGEASGSVANRALRAQAAKIGADPKLLAAVANAMAVKPAAQSSEEAAVAAVGFVVPATIIAAGACLLSVNACIQDAKEFEAGCLEQLCPEGTHLDEDRCLVMAASDMQNCTLTCGMNGPDGDGDRACVKDSLVPRVPPPFVPPTFDPGPEGGFFVGCTEAEAHACEIQSGTRVDSSNGNIISKDCALNDLSGTLDLCMCICVEVVAVSSEMEFESE